VLKTNSHHDYSERAYSRNEVLELETTNKNQLVGMTMGQFVKIYENKNLL
jgi:hypothetical protein